MLIDNGNLAQNPKFWRRREQHSTSLPYCNNTSTSPPDSHNQVNMGRELQKKKNKSSIPKKRQNGPSKKKILQNPIIAKHWYVLSYPSHNFF